MKRFAAVFLILAMVLGLCACGAKNSLVSEFTDVDTNGIPAELKQQASAMPEASYESLPAWRGLEYEVMGDYPDGYTFYT